MRSLLCMGEPMVEYNRQSSGMYAEAPGGDTSNVAVAAARQGVPAAYLTAIGNDGGGDGLMRLWAEEGVDTTGVRRDPHRPTAVYFVTHKPDGHDFAYYRAGSAASHYGPADVPEDAVRGAGILYASGISQGISTSAADAVFHAIGVARQAGVGVAYDTNYRPRLWPARRAAAIIHAAIAQANVALPGLEDARALTGLDDPDAIADFYLRLGPRVVVLKMGASGALLATPDDRERIPPFPCTPVDATGAGDTFCGAFLARLLLNDSLATAARYAACAAALSTNGYGAVSPIPRAAAVMEALIASPTSAGSGPG